MRRFANLITAMTAVAVVTMFVPASGAGATTSTASIKLSKTSGPPTTKVTVTGSGFGSNETVDIDFGALVGQSGWYFHATALWQGGGHLDRQLGLLTSPSGMSSGSRNGSSCA